MTQALLPNRPIVFDDETGASVLIRTAEANGHTTVYQLLSGTGIKINELSLKACLLDPERYRQITRAIGLGEGAAARAIERVGTARNSPRRYGSMTILDQCFRRDEASVFCSQCLTEHPYWRQQWQIRPFSACIIHECLLLDRCLDCGNTPSIGRGELTRCNHCKASLLTMQGATINVDFMIAVRSMLESNQTNALNIVLDFWTALERFDGLGDSPAIEYARLGAAIAHFRGDVAAFEHVVTLVVQRLPLMSPRVQLLPFLSGSPTLNIFAEEIISHVFPLAQIGTGDSRLSYLSKSEVCTILKMRPAKLTRLISSGQLKWPNNGGRQQKISTAEIEMRMQGFSQTEIFYLHSENPNSPMHLYDRSTHMPRRNGRKVRGKHS